MINFRFIGLLSYSSCFTRNPLLVLLYASIISAICNVVDFMVGTSEFVGIEPAQGACQPDKLDFSTPRARRAIKP